MTLYSTTILTDLGSVRAVEPAWRELHSRAGIVSAAQSPEFVIAAIEAATAFAAPRPGLAIICAWRGEKLVGLWPAFREKRSGRTWLVPPGFGANEEYSGPITCPDEQESEILCALMSGAKPVADIVFFTIPAGIDAETAARRTMRLCYGHPVSSPAIDVPADGYDGWLARKSGSFRKGLRYDRRRLEKLGSVELVDARPNCPHSNALIDWIFDEKANWARQKGHQQSWLFNDTAKNLVRNFFAGTNPSRSLRAYALTVDGTPAAGAICLESTGSLEFFVFVINPDYSPYSPGNLLLDELVRRSFDENRAFDFRITSEDYKKRWADTQRPYVTYICATGLRGIPQVAKAALHPRIVAARQFARRTLNRLSALRARKG